jgi:SAM-dependent methyltransferase
MLETVVFNSKHYPSFQTNGHAARFIMPFALEVCKGEGVDVGCNRIEWKFSGAHPVDPQINQYHATDFPYRNLDYVFSSHCLEHIPDWVGALEYWTDSLKSGGILFLYLPDYSQEYWRPWNNRKHFHSFTPNILRDYISSTGKFVENKTFVSGIDLYNAFTVIAEKI